jgi:hypothetical protein
MAAREILFAVIESTYGTTKTTPTLGTDSFYMRLDREGAFVPSPAPNVVEIMYGGGVAIKADEATDTVGVPFRFQFRLYPGIWSATLLKWAMTPINSGRTAPWTTTAGSPVVLPVGDLASMTFYHAVLTQDGTTYDRKKYLGCKCHEWEVACSDQGDARVFTLIGSGVAQKVVGNPWDSSSDPDATEFPLPAEANYPTGPYIMGHLASGTGTVTVASDRKATATLLRIRGQNTMAPNFYTGRFLFSDRFCGRMVTAQVGLRYTASPDDRLSFWNRTSLDSEFKLDNGTNTVKIDFNAKNEMLPWERGLPLDREYTQQFTLKNRWDPTAATDITLTTS